MQIKLEKTLQKENGKQFITLAYDLKKLACGDIRVYYGGHTKDICCRANGAFILPVKSLAIPFKSESLDITEQVASLDFLQDEKAVTFTKRAEYMWREYDEKARATIESGKDLSSAIPFIKQVTKEIDEKRATKADAQTLANLCKNAMEFFASNDEYNAQKLKDAHALAEIKLGCAIDGNADESTQADILAECDNIKSKLTAVEMLNVNLTKAQAKAEKYLKSLKDKETKATAKAFLDLCNLFEI
jgi:hypothetical protein